MIVWHLLYSKGRMNGIGLFPSAISAIETACRMLDDGYEIRSIGRGHPTGTPNRARLIELHAFWVQGRIARNIPG